VEIDSGAYQAMRTSQKCGPSGVNHECSVLQQMLKRIGKWHEIEHQYQALRLLDRGPGRVLSPEERTRLFQVSARKENWEGAFLFAVKRRPTWSLFPWHNRQQESVLYSVQQARAHDLRLVVDARGADQLPALSFYQGIQIVHSRGMRP
jgi:hypothetical protein